MRDPSDVYLSRADANGCAVVQGRPVRWLSNRRSISGIDCLRGLHLRLNLVHGANGYGLPDGDAGAEDASG
jgi:hypothetical protein